MTSKSSKIKTEDNSGGLDNSECWNGIERRETCQGCSDIYSRLIKYERENLAAHIEIWESQKQKVFRRDILILAIACILIFTVVLNFRVDSEERFYYYFKSMNQNLNETVLPIEDLIRDLKRYNIINRLDAIEDKLNIDSAEKELHRNDH